MHVGLKGCLEEDKTLKNNCLSSFRSHHRHPHHHNNDRYYPEDGYYDHTGYYHHRHHNNNGYVGREEGELFSSSLSKMMRKIILQKNKLYQDGFSVF